MSEKKERLKVDMGSLRTEMKEVDFPANSHKSKTVKPKSEKKVEKITSGKVVKKKRSLGKKISDTFFGDDVESVSSYVIYDVMIPAAKNMISDTVSNGIEMLLFGSTRGSRTRRDRGKSYVSYSNYYQDRDRYYGRTNNKDREISQRNRARHNFDDIILETRGEAEEVLSHLVDLTEDFGVASVADLYDLVGITSAFTDNKYGWDNLASSRVVGVRGGYLLELPRPIVLD